MHYLIVEDDLVIATILKEVLQLLESNVQFTFFTNGTDAWDWVDKVEANKVQTIPDVAFLDIRMPGPQGHEVAERIRQTALIKNMGIILMTAYELSAEEYEEVMQRSQADRYISKPLPGVKGLNQMIEEIMSVRKTAT
jgi:CheY-like chemotaxis protein